MSDFFYEARDETGQTISGRIRAMDVKDAIRQLEANDWDVVSVRTVPKPASEQDPVFEILPSDILSDEPAPREIPPLSRKDSVEISRHLAEVIQAGLPLIPGLSALASELPDGRIRRGLRAMIAQLEAGKSLESVLESRHVPADLRGLVRAGLRSGHTGEVLSQYVRHTQQVLDLRRHIALAWGYPLVLILCMLGIFFFFLWVLVPNFNEIYQDFETELPAMTRSLVSLSRWLRDYWPIFLAVIAGINIVFWFIWRFAASPAQRQRFLWSLPLAGTLIRSASLARFSRLLGLLLESKMPLPEALRFAGEGAADAELAEASLYLADVVESGQPLTGNEYASRRLPATLIQLLSQLDNRKPQPEAVDTLSKACVSSANLFESQARVAAIRIAALCPPFIAILTFGVMAYLIISLFLPLFKLLNDLS